MLSAGIWTSRESVGMGGVVKRQCSRCAIWLLWWGKIWVQRMQSMPDTETSFTNSTGNCKTQNSIPDQQRNFFLNDLN